MAANQSVDCHATTLFTIDLNSAKVRNRGFNRPVFGSIRTIMEKLDCIVERTTIVKTNHQQQQQ